MNAVAFWLGIALACVGAFLAVIPAGLGVHYYVGAAMLLSGIVVVAATLKTLDR